MWEVEEREEVGLHTMGSISSSSGNISAFVLNLIFGGCDLEGGTSQDTGRPSVTHNRICYARYFTPHPHYHKKKSWLHKRLHYTVRSTQKKVSGQIRNSNTTVHPRSETHREGEGARPAVA